MEPCSLERLAQIGGGAQRQRDQNLANVALRASFTPLRICITYFQVTAQLGQVLHINLPTQMSLLLDWFRPMIDIWEVVFSAQCMGFGGFVSKWLGKIVGLPIIAGIVVYVIYMYERCINGIVLHGKGRRAMGHVFFAIFFVYPTICNIAFATFNCRSLDSGISVLIEDDRLLCEDPTVVLLRYVSLGVIIVFAFGVPAYFGTVLANMAMNFEREVEQDSMQELAEWTAKRLDVPIDEAVFVIRDVLSGRDVSFLVNAFQAQSILVGSTRYAAKIDSGGFGSTCW